MANTNNSENNSIVNKMSHRKRNSLSSLKIIAINTNSLISLSKRYKLLNFLDTNKPDIALISETKLNKRYKIQFENYDIIRADRLNSQKGGGTAIIINRHFPYQQIFSPSSSNNKIVEYTRIKIQNNNYNLFITSLYVNNLGKRIFIDEIKDLFHKLDLTRGKNYYVMAGDLNARHTEWGDSVDKIKGTLLKRWEISEGLLYRAKIIHPANPSYPSSGSYIDLCIVDSRLEMQDTISGKINTLDYPSDHKALIFTVCLPTHLNTIEPSLNYRFMFKKTKWKKFQKNLNNLHNTEIPNNKNLNIPEIDNYIDQLSNSIQSAIEISVPKYKPKDNVLSYVNHRIKKLHKTKSLLISYLNKNYKIHNNRIDTNFIKYLINHLNMKLKAEYKIAYIRFWEAQVKQINHRNAEALFPKINTFFKKHGFN